MKRLLRTSVMTLIVAILLATLTGCGSDKETSSSTPATIEVGTSPTVIPIAASDMKDTVPVAGQAIDGASLEADGLDPTQRNSISMLNHLAVLTQEINASQNSRLYLEEAYSLLINNTNPNAVDSRTLSQLSYILDTLEKYRMVAVKRERLAYVYEQNRAQALRSAVPNPLGLMSAVQSFDMKKLAASVAYMAVDSATSYTAATSQADMQYLQDGWALNDEAATALHNSRKDTFAYMVRIVGDYHLPGELALSEAAVDEFVEWENNDNVVQRIRFLESNVETYRALGMYWLVLAESYYENGQYIDCLNAIASYEELSTGIFRKDYAFARVLPLAIISAGETMSGSDYIDAAEHYTSLILANTDYDDWVSHYFVAQTYVDMYARTDNDEYLTFAYNVVLNSVNSLVNEQKAMNAEYLAPIAVVGTPKDATKAQKADIKKYNDMLKEQRKTALPPVYEPLLLNCELLFALSDELHIDEQNKATIQNILHQNGESIFLTEPLDRSFWFDRGPSEPTSADIAFDGKQITLPTNLVSASSIIRASVIPKDAEETIVFEDWRIEKVERGTEGDLSTFIATFKSETADKYKYVPDANIAIEIMTSDVESCEPISFEYETVSEKMFYIFNTVGFRRVEE